MKQALQVLGLKEGASQDEVKSAFRDLVKVWHPDRFGSDVRLRAKADLKLKEINEAYIVLRDGGTETSAASSADDVAPDWPSQNAPPAKKTRQVQIAALIFYGFCTLALIAMGAYAWHVIRAVQRPGAMAADVAQPAASSPAEAAPTAASPKKTRHAPVQEDASSDDTPAFEVLTEAETARVQAVCMRKRRSGDMRGYSACVHAQVKLMRKYEIQGPSLSSEEQDSLTSACAADSARKDEAGYARCTAFYREQLQDQGERPNMAALSEADRNAVETTCANSKSEGPATYDHCMMGFVRAIMNTQ